MALKLGWAKDDWRETVYWRDPSIDWERTPEDARQRYQETGDATGMRLVADGTCGMPPTLIRFRALTAEERAIVMGLCHVAREAGESETDYAERLQSNAVHWARLLLWAFRVGVDFPGLQSQNGVRVRVREHGLSVLHGGIVDYLAREYGDDFYLRFGRLVWSASTLEDDEKKAS